MYEINVGLESYLSSWGLSVHTARYYFVYVVIGVMNSNDDSVNGRIKPLSLPRFIHANNVVSSTNLHLQRVHSPSSWILVLLGASLYLPWRPFAAKNCFILILLNAKSWAVYN